MAARIRTRSRSDYRNGKHFYEWGGQPNVIQTNGPVMWPSFRFHQAITDVVGTPRSTRVKPMSLDSLIYFGLPYQKWLGDYGVSISPAYGVGPYIEPTTILAAVPLAPQSAISTCAGEAFIDFSKRYPSVLSGGEFVMGLLEFRSLLPKLQESVLKTLAGGYLNYKFGWESLLTDLNVLNTIIQRLQERMVFLRKTYGKPTKLRFRKKGIVTKSNTSWISVPLRGFGTRVTQISYQCDFNAVSSLVQRLDHIDDEIGWLRAVVISLGLNNPLKVIWEQMPMSFVVDWFLNVGDHLDRLATVQPGEEWSLFDTSSSVDIVSIFKVEQVHTGLFGQASQTIDLGELRVRRYRRFVGLPVDLSVYTPSTLNPAQLTLLSAMIAANVR